MRTAIALCCFLLIVDQSIVGEVQKTDPDRLERGLVGTWESALPPGAPKSIRHVKHVTPTHYTWVTSDLEGGQILATSGGTWSLKGGKYEEVCEFATDSHQHLRGKTYAYALKLEGDRWALRAANDSDIDVDEVWNRKLPDDDQKANVERSGRDLSGTWEFAMPKEAPKAMRKVKHVTPTHWTWVVFDRENKMVLAAAGGTWSLKSGKYEEFCKFTTDNFTQARKKSSPFVFKVEGDTLRLGQGQDLGGQQEEIWKRVK